MMGGLQHLSVLQSLHGGSFFYNGLCSNTKSRNDGLSNLINKFAIGGPWNPLSPASRGTFHEISSPVSRRDLVNYEPIFYIFMTRLFVEELVHATAEAPIVRVKLLLQNQGELIKSGRLSTPYKGITDCFTRIIKNEGVISLWRGNSARLLRIFPEQALNVVLNATFMKLVYNFYGERDRNKSQFFRNLIAGAFCYMCFYPMEYAHTRLANDIKCVKMGGERQFNGLVDVYRKTLKSDGISGIYHGVNIACIGVTIHNCIFWSMLSPVKRDPSKKISLGRDLLDTVVPTVAALASYPFNTLATRMMMTSGEAFKYKNSADAFVQIIKNEGIRSLYKGFGANMLCFVPLFCVATAWKKWGNHTKPGACISVVIETK